MLGQYTEGQTNYGESLEVHQTPTHPGKPTLFVMDSCTNVMADIMVHLPKFGENVRIEIHRNIFYIFIGAE